MESLRVIVNQSFCLASTAARIKPCGPYLQNRWFKCNRLKNNFFNEHFLPEVRDGQKSSEIRLIFSGLYI